MSEFLLGIDIGTSACKAAVFDREGCIIASAYKEYKIYYPQKGWAEQNPLEWYDAVCAAVNEVVMQVGAESIAAVGVDGQSWSAVPIDKAGNVLHNTPIWFDTRAIKECEELERNIGNDRVFKVCKNPLKPSYSAPKALWFKKHLPDVYNNTYKFLQSNGYIAYRLTGILTQDKSQGYGMFFYNMDKGQYDVDLCDEVGLDIEKYPEIVDCHKVIGEINLKSASETGLKTGTPVIAGGLDAACGSLGAGVFKSGQTQEQGGQAGGVSICVDRPLTHPMLILGSHVVPGLWLLQGGTVGGGGIMRWLSNEFGGIYERQSAETGKSIMSHMDMEAGQINAGADGLIFLPYMAGERSPIWDVDAKGVLFGLTYNKGRAHIIRAAMEGGAYSLLHNIKTAEDVGVIISEMNAMGGAANSSLWTQIKCNVTNIPIKVPNSDNATTLGSAILAGVGTGYYKDFEEAVSQTVRITREHMPDENVHQVYKDFYPIYLEIYEKLKDTMKKV